MGANDLDSKIIDGLIAGSAPIMSKEVVIDTGVLKRGTVLGKIAVGTVPTTGTAGGGNTGGSGAMTAVAGKRRTKVGTYTMTCIAVVANKGQFEVVNPDGKLIGIAIVGTAFVSDEIGFSIADATDFVVGDSFTVVVPAGTGKYVKVDKAALNGSGVADSILAEDVDATSADVTTVAYHTGIFSRAALIFAAGNTYADHEADLRVNDIHLKVTVPA